MQFELSSDMRKLVFASPNNNNNKVTANTMYMFLKNVLKDLNELASFTINIMKSAVLQS